MKKITFKFLIIMLITILSLALIPTNVFAVYENAQVVKSGTNYIVYIEGMDSKDFKFATSNGNTALNPDDISLNYINSVKDNNGDGENSVAVINEDAKFLYIKEGTEPSITKSVIELNLIEAFDKETMEEVENTTKRIVTEVKENLSERNEKIDGTTYIRTVGGLEIKDDNRKNYTYEYISVKLPTDKYSDLQELANELNESYSEKTMYEKIKFAKQFNNLYKELINSASWQSLDNYLIKQPIGTNDGDRYIVLLKRTARDGKITYDAKFMISSATPEEKEETNQKQIKETTKLPITGDNLILFAILVVIIIALIIVFTKMKKARSKGKKQ